MKIHRCCESTPCGTGLDMPAARPSFAGRLLRLTGWLVPSTILVLMPKCPACLAAYVAIGTGLALTASTASYLRAALVMMCAASLTYLAARHMNRTIKTHPAHNNSGIRSDP